MVVFSRILKMTLELDPTYEVCVENDLRQAIVTVRNFCPDIIILDVNTPHPDGDADHAPFMADPVFKLIPVLRLKTMANQQEVDEHNGRSEGWVYVAKPVNASRLIELIEQYVRF